MELVVLGYGGFKSKRHHIPQVTSALQVQVLQGWRMLVAKRG
jgi:hypothetical protein